MNICVNCQAKLTALGAPCPYCGSEHLPTHPPLINDEAIFVGNNYDYYKNKWKVGEDSYQVTFNLAALLLPVCWLAYRKMYFPIFIIALLFTGMNVLVKYIYPLKEVLIFLEIPAFFLVMFITGFTGNMLYQRHTKRKITRINKKYHTAGKCIEELEIQGGTSFSAIFFGLLIIIAVYLIPSAFIVKSYDPIAITKEAYLPYTEYGADRFISIDRLFRTVFTDINWQLIDNKLSGAELQVTATYMEADESYHFTSFLLFDKENQTVKINEIRVNGQALIFSEDFGPYHFLFHFDSQLLHEYYEK